MATLDEHISVSIIRLLIMLVSILGNTVILFAILSHKQLRKTGANILLAQLAFADLIIGIATGIRGISSIVFEQQGLVQYNKGLCLIIGSPTVFGIHLSQTTMMVIACDRLLCIRFPIQYRNMETSFFSFLRFLLCFGYSLIGTGIAYFSFPTRKEAIFVCSTGNAVPIWYRTYYAVFGNTITIAIYVFYISIYVMFRRQRHKTKLGAQGSLFVTITAILSFYFFLCVLPNIAVVVGTVVERDDANSEVAGYIALLLALGNGVNASINVFIYGWKHKELRNQLLKYRILRCLFGCCGKNAKLNVTVVTVVSKMRNSTNY